MKSFLNGNSTYKAISARFSIATGRLTIIERDKSNSEVGLENIGSGKSVGGR